MEIEKVLKEIGNDVIETVHDKMDETGAGSLKKQISIKLTKNGFVILSTKLIDYVNYGRRPGKMPYSEWLKPWAKKRSIPLSALFPIARKIGKDGTKGKFFLDVLDKAFDRAEDKLANILEKEVADEIKEKK